MVDRRAVFLLMSVTGVTAAAAIEAAAAAAAAVAAAAPAQTKGAKKPQKQVVDEVALTQKKKTTKKMKSSSDGDSDSDAAAVAGVKSRTLPPPYQAVCSRTGALHCTALTLYCTALRLYCTALYCNYTALYCMGVALSRPSTFKGLGDQAKHPTSISDSSLSLSLSLSLSADVRSTDEHYRIQRLMQTTTAIQLGWRSPGCLSYCSRARSQYKIPVAADNSLCSSTL